MGRALIIGVENYAQSHGLDATLPGTTQAATRFRQWLIERKQLAADQIFFCAEAGARDEGDLVRAALRVIFPPPAMVLCNLEMRLGYLRFFQDDLRIRIAMHRLGDDGARHIDDDDAPFREVLLDPRHPYTLGLVRSAPDFEYVRESLVPIPGSPPSLITPPPGCRFHPRCAFVEEDCRVTDTPLRLLPGGRATACLHYERCLEAVAADRARP